MAKKRGTSKFRSAVAANSKQQRTQGSGYGYLNLPRGVNVFKEPTEGRIQLDMIPYIVTEQRHPDRNDEIGMAIPGEQWYKRPFKIHRNIGSKNEAVVCLQSVGKRCPVCDFRAQRIKEGAEDEELKALKASNRNLYLVVPRDHKELEEKIHIWDISQFLFQDKLNEEIEENEDMGVFPDTEEGLTLKIRFAENQIGKNKFGECSRIDFVDRKKPIDGKLLKTVPDLDLVLKIYTYAELEALFLELDEDMPKSVREEKINLDDDEEEDEKPKASKRKKKPEPEEEEEEEPDDDDADDEDEEDADDSEEEDEDEDDEEEPEEDDDDEDDEEEPEEDDDDEEEEPDDDDVCVACKGTGKNSRGGKCKPCDGTGVKKTATKSEPRKAEKKGKNKCPHGHVFGTDCEEFDECDDCEKWSDCIDAKEA